MFIGGLAVIARGAPRHTTDVDAAVWGPEFDVDRALSVLAEAGIVPRVKDVEAFIRRGQILQLRHEPSGTGLDVSLGWLPYELEAMETADRLDLHGVTVPVARPEDLVVYKAVAWRLLDQADVETLVRLHCHTIDLDRVRDLVAQFAEVLEVPERVAELDRVIARALGEE